MAGLFTLNSQTQGKLNTNALAGFGTGFVAGESSSTGVVAGVQGFTGTVTGSTTFAGSVAGVVGFEGTASGLLASSGSALGNAARIGLVGGVTLSNGSVTGVENDQGLIVGVSNSVGFAVGFPGCEGLIVGVTTSTGSAAGSPDVPPTPPEPEAAGGSAYSPYKLVHWQPPKSKDPIAKAKHFSGKISSITIGKSFTLGFANNFGAVAGSTLNLGFVEGVKYPTDEIVARCKRQKLENELLSIGLF